MTKKVWLLALVFLQLILFCSCGSNETIAVLSVHYNIDKMKSSEFDVADIKYKLSGDYKYSGYDCFVTKINKESGECLVISNDHSVPLHSLGYSDGYIVGTDDKYERSCVIAYSAIAQESICLFSDRCIGLFDSDGNFDSNCQNDYFYALTAWNYYDESTSIKLHKVCFPKKGGSDFITEKIYEIEDENAIASIMTEENVIYIISSESFYKTDLQGEVTKISVPEEWKYLLVNSLVEVNDYIYIGTHCGVLRYNPNGGDFLWFPFDYEDLD